MYINNVPESLYLLIQNKNRSSLSVKWNISKEEETQNLISKKSQQVRIVIIIVDKNLEFFFLNGQCESCRVGAKQYEYIFFGV